MADITQSVLANSIMGKLLGDNELAERELKE
jgi:hypothetical protein